MNALRLDLRLVGWMTLSMVLVTVPHVERLPAWVSALAGAFIGWRLYLSWRQDPMPRKWLLLLLVGCASAGIYLSYGTLFGRDAGVALLVVMLTLKMLEMSTMRDAMVVIFLSYFVVLTNLLYSQTIPTAALMLVGIWVITATMIGLQWPGGAARPRDTLRMSGVMMAQATPLMMVLFLLFPRVQGPIWGVPQDAYSGLTGLSDSMSPGSLSEVTLSDAVAFRVRFEGALPKQPELYWRGPVLWYFDGGTWHTGLALESGPASYAPTGPSVSYTVTMEPHNRRWLFALDLPATTPPQSRIISDYQILAQRPVRQRLRYDMTSHPSYRLGYGGLTAFERRRGLQLPEGYNLRSRDLAGNMRSAARDDRELVRNVLSMFRAQKFYYTLSPPLLGEHPVDDFLFNRRSGFCEHYASAFVFLMRAAGIPARVVTGYQGGELNPVGNYMIVRQSEAHAWAEVWLEGDGWVRVDPTAAVSPQRVESGLSAAVPAADTLPLLGGAELEWMRQLRFTWDSLANNWNQWVLGYNPERQYQLLSQVGLDRATWRTLALTLVCLTAIITAALAATLLWRLRARPRDPAAAAYRRFCAKLARHGVVRGPAEGPLDFAERACRELPEAGQAIDDVTALYVALRYGKADWATALPELRRRVRAFEVPRRQTPVPATGPA